MHTHNSNRVAGIACILHIIREEFDFLRPGILLSAWKGQSMF